LLATRPLGLQSGIIETIQRANQQAIKLLRMMEEMLFIQRMQSNEFQIRPSLTDLTQLIDQAVLIMSKTILNQSVSIHYQPAMGNVMVMLDRDIIERVLNNLLNNAIKYALPDTRIEVELETSEKDVTVHVSNSGDPIPEAYHDKIFELFSRVNLEDKTLSGTGIGLSFCRLAIHAHHGSIWVTSPIPPHNHGARFSFRLPSLHSS
jgi:two-component system, sensor histidine kinase and response regulator